MVNDELKLMWKWSWPTLNCVKLPEAHNNLCSFLNSNPTLQNTSHTSQSSLSPWLRLISDAVHIGRCGPVCRFDVMRAFWNQFTMKIEVQTPPKRRCISTVRRDTQVCRLCVCVCVCVRTDRHVLFLTCVASSCLKARALEGAHLWGPYVFSVCWLDWNGHS